MTAISTIHNLGPATEAAFARAGIDSAESLRALGADAGYLRLLEAGGKPHFIWYYILVMAQQGRPRNDCRSAGKEALRARFDAIKARVKAKGRPELEAALDVLGVIPRR